MFGAAATNTFRHDNLSWHHLEQQEVVFSTFLPLSQIKIPVKYVGIVGI